MQTTTDISIEDETRAADDVAAQLRARRELRRRSLILQWTDDYGAARQLMAAAFRFWRKEGGGDVPALASSLHMLEDVGFRIFRLKARPPRTPFSEKRSRRLRDAAVFASGSFLQSLRSHGVQCLPLRLFSHPRRADRSIRGSSLRLPEARGALNPEARRRCTWFRQFRDAVDTVPSFPEPSRTLYSYNRNMSRGLGK